MLWRRVKQERGGGPLRRGLPEKVGGITGTRVPGRGNSQSRGPEVGACLESPRNSQRASEVGTEQVGAPETGLRRGLRAAVRIWVLALVSWEPRVLSPGWGGEWVSDLPAVSGFIQATEAGRLQGMGPKQGDRWQLW